MFERKDHMPVPKFVGREIMNVCARADEPQIMLDDAVASIEACYGLRQTHAVAREGGVPERRRRQFGSNAAIPGFDDI